MISDQPWTSRLVFTMTGQSVPSPATAAPDLDEVLAWLTANGWDHDSLHAHATDLKARDLPWPHPVPREWLHDLGPARWLATLTALRQRLGLDSETLPPSHRTRLNADERRLLIELPPHHVG